MREVQGHWELISAVNPDAPPVTGTPVGSGPAWNERPLADRLVGEVGFATNTDAVPLMTESDFKVMKEPSLCRISTDRV